MNQLPENLLHTYNKGPALVPSGSLSRKNHRKLLYNSNKFILIS